MLHKKLAHNAAHELVAGAHNDFTPLLLRERAVVGTLFLGGLLFLFSQLAALTGNFGLTAEVLPAIVVQLTNKDRGNESLPPLAVNPALERAAQMKANDMAANGYFAHTSPTGVSPWHWFAQAEYAFLYAGENLAVNFDDSQTVQTAWLESPTHRANVMSANFTEIGVATAQGVYKGVPTTFVVEMFGSPATARAMQEPVVPASPAIPEAPEEASSDVAGEAAKTPVSAPVSAPSPQVVQQQGTFIAAQNMDPTLVPAPGASSVPTKVPWYLQIAARGDRVAGIVLTVVLVTLFFTTASMVAREYEKRHLKHMAYGGLMMVIFFSFLVIGRFGELSFRATAAAPSTPFSAAAP